MSRGVRHAHDTLDETLCFFSLKDRAVEQPGPLAKRMDGVDVTSFRGDAKYFCADAEPGSGLAQVHPTLSVGDFRTMDTCAPQPQEASERAAVMSKPEQVGPGVKSGPRRFERSTHGAVRMRGLNGWTVAD